MSDHEDTPERDGRDLAWACECECGEHFWTDGYPGDAFCPFCSSDEIAFVPPEDTIWRESA